MIAVIAISKIKQGKVIPKHAYNKAKVNILDWANILS